MNATRILVALLLALASAPASDAATRHYYIAAEDVVWDYAPSAQDLLHGQPIPLPWSAQLRWKKTRYIEYTDATFSVRKPQPEWLGILGPIIRAEVGDTIVVEFLNRSVAAHSIHPHGLRYDKANEGALYLPYGAGARVAPGQRFTYRWFADEGSGPGADGSSSAVWWYHPHTAEASESNAGLLGPIIITAKGKANPDGSPKDVDREFVAMFMIFDEMTGKPAGLFHSINGYVFGNLPGLVIKKGEKVRWYLLAMGNERDLHTPHWHGKTVQYGKRNTDVIELLPGSMVAVDMVADNPGTWLFHCQVSDHMESGMMAVYTIYEPQKEPCPIQFVAGDFWSTPGKFFVTVKNVGAKPIQNLEVAYDHLMTSQYRRRPFNNLWSWPGPIEPGQQKSFEMQGYLPGHAEGILGWALFPKSVTYQDRIWRPTQDGQCFQVLWRDKQQPQPVVLPPLQMETRED
jgi:FtsP/CotA-like multicopper oxidase with cupredoxin domain